VASTSIPGGERLPLERSPLARLPDRALRYGLTVLAALILVLIVYFFFRLVGEASPIFEKEGVLGFTFGEDWNVGAEQFGALPLVIGTLITSALALLMGVPIAVAGAIYATEICPLRLRGPLTILVDLLAAVPSVVYGLWGVLVLAPNIQPVYQSIADATDGIPVLGAIFGGQAFGRSFMTAGIILAIMIVPIVTSLSREVIATVPSAQREAAYGMGATRWETLLGVMLPTAAPGILAGVILGLGRALGETMALAMLAGGSNTFSLSLFSPINTLAALLANNFQEVTEKADVARLMYAALVLLAITLGVNILGTLVLQRAMARFEGKR